MTNNSLADEQTNTPSPSATDPPTGSCRLDYIQNSMCACAARYLSPQGVELYNSTACAVVQPSGSQWGAPDTLTLHLLHTPRQSFLTETLFISMGNKWFCPKG